MKYIVGERISDVYLGYGQIVKIIGNTSGYVAFWIMFDKIPPTDYNMGSNPCLRYSADIISLDSSIG